MLQSKLPCQPQLGPGQTEGSTFPEGLWPHRTEHVVSSPEPDLLPPPSLRPALREAPQYCPSYVLKSPPPPRWARANGGFLLWGSKKGLLQGARLPPSPPPSLDAALAPSSVRAPPWPRVGHHGLQPTPRLSRPVAYQVRRLPRRREPQLGRRFRALRLHERSETIKVPQTRSAQARDAGSWRTTTSSQDGNLTFCVGLARLEKKKQLPGNVAPRSMRPVSARHPVSYTLPQNLPEGVHPCRLPIMASSANGRAATSTSPND